MNGRRAAVGDGRRAAVGEQPFVEQERLLTHRQPGSAWAGGELATVSFVDSVAHSPLTGPQP